MANFIRLAKSGSDWSWADLHAYNITIVEKDEQEFLVAALPDYNGPAGFIQHKDPTQELDRNSLALIKRLNLAMEIIEGEESDVDDFTAEVLRTSGYEKENVVVRTHKSLRLSMCGEQVYAKTDVCMQDVDSENFLLVQENKWHIGLVVDPEAQLVAEAIAAFQMNNANRKNNLFLSPLPSYVFPGIIVLGTFPRFYKIKVTLDLDEAVRFGQYPTVETVVERHTPRVPGRHSDGMKPLDNRIKILRCYEAFKQFVYPEVPSGDDNN